MAASLPAPSRAETCDAKAATESATGRARRYLLMYLSFEVRDQLAAMFNVGHDAIGQPTGGICAKCVGERWPARLVATTAEDRLSFGGQLLTYSRSPFETGMKRHAFR